MFEKYFNVVGLDRATSGTVCPMDLAMKSVMYKVELRNSAGAWLLCGVNVAVSSYPIRAMKMPTGILGFSIRIRANSGYFPMLPTAI